ncbi:MAG: bifunctional folylpolyglutamate synthase/dihydrofolate synthase [Chlorobi bacterium]|nr:bifunctional folylpolyglutamate synthase/dihydrofolate synthase [Chlorobiota bacterium]
MTYKQAMDYLFSQLPMFQRVGAAAYKADLNNTISLCKILDNPEQKFPSIHIAGTNGKGSVSHMIASVLQTAGFKTGLYTSPHLKDFRERIRINGKKIPKEYVVDFVKKNKSGLTRISPSFFEYTFGMAVSWFAEENIDIAIMETGMGGRLDSTNVVKSVLSVITNIGLDHTEFLGDTLEKIAIEKAGIIKPGIPVVIGETQSETKAVFSNKAKELNSNLFFADKEFELRNKRTMDKSYSFDIFKKNKIWFEDASCDLTGVYQLKNIVTATNALEVFSENNPISKENIRKGLSNVVQNTSLLGRWQILQNKPLSICDTGHNANGISMIVSQLTKTHYNKLHFVIGMVNDKNIESVLSLLPKDATYYFCKANVPRALNAKELQKTAGNFGLKGEFWPTVREAYSAALSNANTDDLVFTGGSTFVVAEVI